MTYTEADIHTLSGIDLDTAIANVVLGDDLTASTDERIGLAVVQYYDRSDLSIAWGISVWCRRELSLVPKEQADLEAHVANWRAKARPYSTDANLLPPIWPKCAKIQRYGEQWDAEDRNSGEFLGSHSTLNQAVCRAALLVELRQQTNKGD